MIDVEFDKRSGQYVYDRSRKGTAERLLKHMNQREEASPTYNRLVAVLVIYVDDGFLISFDDDVTKDTQKLLNQKP